jgi:host factor-I protein
LLSDGGAATEGQPMKDDSTAARRAPEPAADDFSNRKLIRPTLTRADAPPERRERPMGGGRKPTPPEQTHAENFYYQKQMQTHTPLVVVLKDGEQIHGTIEWYDRDCIKISRNNQSNILVYKPSIKYIYKDESGGNNGRVNNNK